MNLRIKILGFIGAMIIASIIILYLCLKMIVLSNVTDVEVIMANNNVNRISNFITYKIDTLDSINHSWAKGDDSFNYVQGKLSNFEESVLTSSMYISSDVDVIAYLDMAGNPVFARTYDSTKNEFLLDETELHKFLDRRAKMFTDIGKETKMAGIVMIGTKPALFSVHSILPSNNKSAPSGTLIMAKFLDEAELSKMSKILVSQIKIFPLHDDILFKFRSGDIYVENFEGYQLAYLLLRDCEGRPTAVMQSTIKRNVYASTQENLWYFLSAIIFICILLCLAIMWLLEKSILSRLTKLNNKIDEIEETENISIRIEVNGNDEISQLSSSMNEMLDMIEKSQCQLEFLSMYDTLTGLYNRTSFEREMEKIKKNNIACVTIMICDVDGLKKINDSKGHKEGDKLLINVANILKRCFRDEDKLFRIGGDEFSAILKVNTMDFVDSVRNRINRAIEDFNTENPDCPLSVSIGFACSGENCKDINELFKEADNKMYKEKAEHHRTRDHNRTRLPDIPC